MARPKVIKRQQGKAYDKEKILESLKQYFLLGYNRSKACMFAGFDPKTLSKWESKDNELSVKINSWINYVNSKSRENVARSITEERNKEDSKWWLERREKKAFSTRREHVGDEEKPLSIKVTYDK